MQGQQGVTLGISVRDATEDTAGGLEFQFTNGWVHGISFVWGMEPRPFEPARLAFEPARLGLVKVGEASENLQSRLCVLVLPQHQITEAAALHMHQLVPQYIADGYDWAVKCMVFAQPAGVAVASPVGEFWKQDGDKCNLTEMGNQLVY